MPTVKTITPGDRFGRWTTLERTEYRRASGTRVLFHECQCDCGNIQFVNIYKLRTGHSRSCGCLQAQRTSEVSRTHGLSKTRIYRIWSCMISRCNNPKSSNYERYGGRGITVCERWLKFENFFEDMGEPLDNTSIDRLDNNGGYHKDNCAWRTASEQALNRRPRRKRLTSVQISE